MEGVGIIRTRVPRGIVFLRGLGGLNRMVVVLCEWLRVPCQIGDDIEQWFVLLGSGTEGVGASLHG